MLKTTGLSLNWITCSPRHPTVSRFWQFACPMHFRRLEVHTFFAGSTTLAVLYRKTVTPRCPFKMAEIRFAGTSNAYGPTSSQRKHIRHCRLIREALEGANPMTFKKTLSISVAKATDHG
jgi:hypothetical protein